MSISMRVSQRSFVSDVLLTFPSTDRFSKFVCILQILVLRPFVIKIDESNV